MPLKVIPVPGYEIDGMTVHIELAERHDHQFIYTFRIQAGKHEVSGGGSDTPFPTEIDAHVAATAHARSNIRDMLRSKPLEDWISYGVGA